MTVCDYVHVWVQASMGAKKGWSIPGGWVTGSYELTDKGAEVETQVLCKGSKCS